MRFIFAKKLIFLKPDFSNSVDTNEIEKLAELDEKDSIKQLQEVYADYYAVNHELFTLNIDTCIGINKLNFPNSDVYIYMQD